MGFFFFFIPVSSSKVFGHSIHYERRRIYLGNQYKLYIITPLSYHEYSVSESSSQQCIGIPLKLLCLFSSILVHHKNFSRQSLIKVPNQYRTHDFFQWQDTSQNFYMAWHVILCSICYTDVPNKGIEQACSWASCDINISPFSTNLYFNLFLSLFCTCIEFYSA